jgi:hypothetical protein
LNDEPAGPDQIARRCSLLAIGNAAAWAVWLTVFAAVPASAHAGKSHVGEQTPGGWVGWAAVLAVVGMTFWIMTRGSRWFAREEDSDNADWRALREQDGREETS